MAIHRRFDTENPVRSTAGDHSALPDGPAASQAYVEGSVATADSSRLVLMLYDELCKQIKVVVAAFGDTRCEDPRLRWSNCLRRLDRCREILSYLIQTLNPGVGEIGQNLLGLYFYLIREIAQVMMEEDVGRLDEILPVIEQLREGWAGIVAGKE